MIPRQTAYRLSRVVLFAGVALPGIAVWAAPAAASSTEKVISTVKVETAYVSSGDAIRIVVRDGPTQKTTAEVRLIRAGSVTVANDVDYQPAAGQSPGLITATIGQDLPFGTYAVQAILNGQPLVAEGQKVDDVVVGPVGGGVVTLNRFDPADIYGTMPFYEKKDGKVRAFETIGVVLRGNGFLFSDSEHEKTATEKGQGIAVWINEARQKIQWDGACGPETLGSKNAPKDHAIHGKVNGSDEAELCYVPAPDSGQLVFAAGFGDSPGTSQLLRVFPIGSSVVTSIAALVALILGLLPLLLIMFVKKSYRIGEGDYRLRMLFLDEETDTYSLSKLQFYLWTVAALFAYSYLFISRVYVQHLPTWPDVPANLPGIILVAAGTAIGSQIVTATRGSKGAGDQHPSLADFVTSGGVVAPDRMQMLLWTLLGIGMFVYAVLQMAPGTITELPTIPDRLLVMMGISSVGYLGGKIARKAGPVISAIGVDPPDSDDALRAQSAPPPALPDVVSAVVSGRAALAGLSSAGAAAGPAVAALKGAVDEAAAAHTANDFNQLVADLAKFRDTAEGTAARVANDFAATPPKASPAEAQAAQQAAVALQDLTAGVTAAIATAAAAPLNAEERPAVVTRRIELRGTNLSPDGLAQIDNADLSFQLLFNQDGANAPDVVSRDEVNPTFAKALRFTIDPSRLVSAQRDQVGKWFAAGGSHTFALVNPDGQRAEVNFTISHGAA